MDEKLMRDYLKLFQNFVEEDLDSLSKCESVEDASWAAYKHGELAVEYIVIDIFKRALGE